MERTLRTAHLVVGAITVGAFLVTGLVSLSLGIRYALPEGAARSASAVAGSLLVLVSCVLLFFAFFAEPMAGRAPGAFSMFGLYALFGGVLLNAAASLRPRPQGATR